ncbi:unnamed protein product [Rotaria sp. Silwood1]|nr:unnamed protein product [Rotaria sp. Silwood1]
MSTENNSISVDFQSWFIPIDILSTICCIISVILALVFLFVIIADKTYHRVSMLLVTNSCLAELIVAIYVLVAASFKLNNDLKQIYFYDSFCILMTCIGYISVGIQNYSYLLQAIYRYILVAYPVRLSYISFKFQAFLISLTWICCIIYSIPLMLTGQIKYLPNEQLCQMPLEFSFITIFNALYIYIIPMSSIVLIYIKMVWYVREMSKHVTPVNRLFHAKRELRMVRRRISLIFIVIAFGLPYQVFIFMSFANRAPKYPFRIAFTFIDVSLIFILIALLQITEPLKTSLMKRINGRPTNTIGAVS